jgi:adenylate kinase
LAPYIKVSDQVLVDRLTGRRTDRRTGKIYHLKYNPPPPGADLEQRPDDAEHTVRRRIAEYYANTAPLLEYYRAAAVLQEFDGELAIADVLKLIVATVRERLAA